MKPKPNTQPCLNDVLKRTMFPRPYLGCREFACFFRLVDPNEEKRKPIDETRDLGFMLYDMDFAQDKDNPSPLFLGHTWTKVNKYRSERSGR